jgi:uncharacterized small protein (DUF1192 family)
MPAFADEDLPRKPPGGHVLGEDLSPLSIEELKRRIDLLKAEIGRMETAIAAKEAQRSVAGSLFKA